METRPIAYQTMRAARANPALAELARHVAASLQGDAQLGPGDLVVGPTGHEYPFLRFPLAGNQRSAPNSILGPPPQGAMEADFVETAEGRAFWQEAEAQGRMIDRRTYRLAGVRRDGQALVLDAVLGSFRDSYLTQDWLERELLLAAAATPQRLAAGRFDEFLARLPARGAMLEKLNRAGMTPSALLHGSRFRSAAIAVSVLLLCRDESGMWRSPVRVRSASGGSIHGGMFHVVPAGMFQPTIGEPAEQWDLSDLVYREFAEELFGEDFDDQPAQVYRDYPPVKMLDALLASPQQASLRLVGFGYSLWNLRPEILLRLTIDTPDWYRTHVLGDPPRDWRDYRRFSVRFNAEHAPGDDRDFLAVADADGRPLDPDRIAHSLAAALRAAGIEPLRGDPFHPAHWVPAGAAALWPPK